ncbi:MAG: hypothetical protein ABI238_04555 [Terrimesophilobacter sp.]
MHHGAATGNCDVSALRVKDVDECVIDAYSPARRTSKQSDAGVSPMGMHLVARVKALASVTGPPQAACVSGHRDIDLRAPRDAEAVAL